MNRYSLHRGWYVHLYHAASVCGNNPRFSADLSAIFHYVQFQVVFFLNIAASAAAAALSFSSDPLHLYTIRKSNQLDFRLAEANFFVYEYYKNYEYSYYK